MFYFIIVTRYKLTLGLNSYRIEIYSFKFLQMTNDLILVKVNCRSFISS